MASNEDMLAWVRREQRPSQRQEQLKNFGHLLALIFILSIPAYFFVWLPIVFIAALLGVDLPAPWPAE